MESVATSRLTKKCQATIPEEIRDVLNLHPGDAVAFDVTEGNKVVLRKATPIDFQYVRALEGTLVSEWLSENDEEAFGDL